MAEEKYWLPTKKNIQEYNLLKDMLHAQKSEFDLLSKKKADGQLNSMKIKMVNRVLKPLKELFKNEEFHEFLDTLNDDELPTNSDVVLIISQYETAITKFKGIYYRIDAHYKRGRSSSNARWITEEEPLDYYASDDDEK